MSDFVGPRPPVTPSSTPSARSGGRLPPDILRDASRRLGVLALLAAALWTTALLVGDVADHVLTQGRTSWPAADFVHLASLVAIAASVALYVYIRRGTRGPQFALDLGLAYLVFLALVLGVMFHWDALPAGFQIYPQISWIGALILIFPAVAPNAPWKVGVASLLAVTMGPLGMLAGRARGAWHFAHVDTAFLMHYPDYILVGVAVVIAHVVTRLGREVSRAREMGSYRLGDLIGRGGMGEVYRASHRMLARPAAIKLIRPEMLGSRDAESARLAAKRFRREAESAANLRSPHTVEIYDFGETEDGTLYFVMELLDGMDLESLVREHGPVPAGRAVHLLRQACESLEEAHVRGLVHRDIKPANIFVGRVGLHHDFVKVVDFGLVKPTGRGRDATLATADGMTPGTPAYMAPELALGEEVDGRADVYALGCVAHFLLTGELVFEAETALQMIARHLQNDPEPPSARTAASIPPALDQLVLDCLAKDPARRPSAAACRERLDAIGAAGWDEATASKWWERAAPPPAAELSVPASPVPA